MAKEFKIIKPAHGYYKGECLDAEIAPTIDTGVGCWHTLIGESNGGNQVQPDRQADRREAGDTIDAFNKRVNKDGVSPTITTRPEGLKTAVLPVTNDYRIRKLTERECFRLMGVKSEDFEKVRYGAALPQGSSEKIAKRTMTKDEWRVCWRIMRHDRQSVSSCYHLAGDSIVTTCLMAIFGVLLEVDYKQKITELTEELKEK